MKSLALVLILLAGVTAQAGENIVCSIIENANPKNKSSVKADLGNLPEDGYFTGLDGIEVGKDHYSYDLHVERAKTKVTLNATFYENNHVQDEVAQMAWSFDISKAKKGKPVVKEPLTDTDDKELMTFVCYYNER